MSTVKTSREISLVDVPCEIEYTYYAGYRGGHGGLYPQIDPDEPACVEIEAVMFAGKDVSEHLSDDVREKLENDLLEEIESDDRDE